MSIESRKYPSKVLLFGEHTVLIGSGALAMPYRKYNGYWIEDERAQYIWWDQYLQYLIGLNTSFLSITILDQLRDKAYVSLDIPIGYGLGSSGALTAAIYDRAHVEKAKDLQTLQARLGLMESFFHGKSSGYDPLISYLNQGIRKMPTGEMLPWSTGLPQGLFCYLFDSGKARKGSDMITQFGKVLTEHPQQFDTIVALNNRIIEDLTLEAKTNQLMPLINKLSKEQFRNMAFMIVPNMKEIWENTLSNDHIAMKICGAGGGGYFLVFSDYEISELGGFSLQAVI